MTIVDYNGTTQSPYPQHLNNDVIVIFFELVDEMNA